MTSRNPHVPHHTEDKMWWCLHGANLEQKFVELCRRQLHLEAQINPQKATDPYAPDLLVAGQLADLKTQNTPFFTAGRYGLDPRFAVTFNRKDVVRYAGHYPKIDIYFWIDWTQTAWKDQRVEYYGGIFRLPFQGIQALVDAGAKEHVYLNRVGDPRNANSSYVFDIRSFEKIFEAPAPPRG